MEINPKFLFLGRFSEEDLAGGHEVQVIQLLVRLLIAAEIRLHLVDAIDLAVVAVLVGPNGGFGAKWTGLEWLQSL